VGHVQPGDSVKEEVSGKADRTFAAGQGRGV
jgi:hypothetical protein